MKLHDEYAIRVRCPRCDAAPGQPCVRVRPNSIDGRRPPVPHVHAPRLAAATTAEEEGTLRNVATELNEVLHRPFGQDVEPCEHACTHVIAGEWTALGAANTLARHSSGVVK